MTARLLRMVTVAVVATSALLFGAAPAFAHSRLIGSDPADGASLDSGPQRVSLTFNESITPGFNAITVIGPDGLRYEMGEVTVDGPTVGIAVRALGPAGGYRIGWRVMSADGHPVTGTIAFTLTNPGPGTGAAAPTADNPAAPAQAAPPTRPAGGGTPVWPWIVGAVVLIGGGVFAALRLGRG